MNTTVKHPLMTSFTLMMAFLFTITFVNVQASETGGDAQNNGTGAGVAGPGPGTGAGPGESAGPGRAGNFKELLGLSDEQVDQIQAIRGENRQKMQKAREEMRNAHQEFQKNAEQAADEAALRKAFQPLGTAFENMEVLKYQLTMEIKAILTPEQFEKFQDMQSSMRQKRGGKERRRQNMQGDQQPQQGQQQ